MKEKLKQIKFDFLHIEIIKEEHIFAINRKRLVFDQIIAFMIIIMMFIIVGVIFNQVSSIKFLFYTFIIAISGSYIFGFYLQESDFINKNKLNYNIFFVLSQRIGVIVNITSLVGVILLSFVLSPFFNSLDLVIILLLSISSTIYLILIEYDLRKSARIIQNNVMLAITLVLFYAFNLLTINSSSAILLLVLTTIGILILLVVGNYFFNNNKFIASKFNVFSKLILIIALVSIFSKNAPIQPSNPVFKTNMFFEYRRDNPLFCDTGVDVETSKMMIYDNLFFIQSSEYVYVMDMDCQIVYMLQVDQNTIIYEMDDRMKILSETVVNEELEEGYKAYKLYDFSSNDSFVEERIIYQYGETASETIIYYDKLAYRVPNDYNVVDGSVIPILQVYRDSNYGTNKSIFSDDIHYKDNDMIIHNSNLTFLFSKYANHEWEKNSFAYSNGMFYSTDYSNWDDDVAGFIETEEEKLSDNTFIEENKGIRIYIDDLPFGRNDISNFEYINNQFVFYTEDAISVFNEKGKLLNTIPEISKVYDILDNDLYFIDKSDNTILYKLSLGIDVKYDKRTHIFRAEVMEIINLDGDVDEDIIMDYVDNYIIDEFVFHNYSIIFNYISITFVMGIITIPFKKTI